MILCASVVLLLGTLHLAYTFFGRKLSPRDPDLHREHADHVAAYHG